MIAKFLAIICLFGMAQAGFLYGGGYRGGYGGYGHGYRSYGHGYSSPVYSSYSYSPVVYSSYRPVSYGWSGGYGGYGGYRSYGHGWSGSGSRWW